MVNEVNSVARPPALDARKWASSNSYVVLSSLALILAAFLVASCAGPWKQAGFTPQEQYDWEGRFSNPAEAKKWRERGWTPDDAYEWKDLTPDDAAIWKEGGFRHREATDWRKSSLFDSPSEAVAWKKAGFDLRSIDSLKAEGISLDAAVFMKKAGIERQEAKQWLKAGFSSEEAVAWRSAGFSASAATTLKKQGLNPETALKSIRERQEAAARAAEDLSEREAASGQCTSERSSELQDVLEALKRVVDEGILRDTLGGPVFVHSEYVLGTAAPKGKAFKFSATLGGTYHLLVYAYSTPSVRLKNKSGVQFSNFSDAAEYANRVVESWLRLGAPGPHMQSAIAFPARPIEEFTLNVQGNGCLLGALLYRP